MPVNPKRSATITKMRETASTAHRKGNYAEAVRLYSFSIDMANQRPAWEPSGLVRDELALLYANRAQSHMAAQNWVEGWKDAESSVECKRIQNSKAWWRGGKCLYEMGRYTDAAEWLTKALELEGKEGEAGKDISGLLADAKRELDKDIKI
ncbi:putative tetratricopeptide repeat domain-containing protein [Phaeomoniella chlamydospora]|uniref:Putative tetratricopeptide repeat domain-containing protein n=1 Tax=Phaeomoniella chlamydospora TaxID=158046 RepID=A0A0G2FXQ5_PHACM|nr:putative tetratricopeptide repeat domain-containing protein [Phaeomoniella chlamydospora]